MTTPALTEKTPAAVFRRDGIQFTGGRFDTGGAPRGSWRAVRGDGHLAHLELPFAASADAVVAAFAQATWTPSPKLWAPGKSREQLLAELSTNPDLDKALSYKA